VRQAGLVAHDVEIRKADLEDVFLNLMKERPALSPSDQPANATTTGVPT
jgi:ABC-2 type transport system ATP-binding protein